METIQMVGIASAVLVVVAAVSVIVRRHGDNRHQDMRLTWRQRRQKVKADKALSYLSSNHLDHDNFTSRFKEYRQKYDQRIAAGKPIGHRLTERLWSLHDNIQWQINEDTKQMQPMLADVQSIIIDRHLKWHAIQQQIEEMCGD